MVRPDMSAQLSSDRKNGQHRSRARRRWLPTPVGGRVAPPPAVAAIRLAIPIALVAGTAGGGAGRALQRAAMLERCALAQRGRRRRADAGLGRARVDRRGARTRRQRLTDLVDIAPGPVRARRCAEREIACNLHANGIRRARRRGRAWLADVAEILEGRVEEEAPGVAPAAEVDVAAARRGRDHRGDSGDRRGPQQDDAYARARSARTHRP